ncbi:MAG: tetratricopeptide repeat protein [Myxococcales bacterium]|nr:tetratricopeptide repeat protein [Myxococcales bacterium]
MASSILPRFLILALGASTLACDSAQPQPQPQPAAPVVAATPPPTPAPAGEVKPEDDPHYLLALEFEAAGRFVEARNEVDLAIAAGAGRDARLLAAKLAILRDDLDAAQRLLEPLASDGKDALVLYNLGLIAQRRGEYNNARTRYIAALKADPNYAATRYNLAVLTWDAGAKDEAKHHAAKFLELSPQDPRGDELRKQVGLEATPAGPAAGTPAPGTPAATTTTTPPAARPPGAGKSASKSDAGDLANPFARR